VRAAGFFCAVLSTAAADFFVLSPRWSFSVEDPANVADLLLFGPLAFYCAMLIGRMRLAIEERALQASKDRLQLALDAALLGWWRYEPRHGLVLGDRRFKEIFDVTKDQMPIEEIKKLFSAEPGIPAGGAEDRRDRATPRCPPKTSPHRPDAPCVGLLVSRVARANGGARASSALWKRLPHARSAGQGAPGTGPPPRARDQSSCQEHAQCRAIAHQTATKNPEHFVERFSERIQALSANQDLLVRNEWRGVDAEDLVRAQLAPFAELIGSRIALHECKVRLNAVSAQAIGLALHELATNAGKYGALSTDNGRIDIDWGTEGETLTMNWTERDGPPVSPPQRRGFGTIVMEQMTERSVGGAVDLDYAPSGLTWRLTCPTANALEPVAPVFA
jgi:two-component sensor histidine kinase